MAAPAGVLRTRSVLHNCVSSSTSSRTGASVSFADDEATADPKPEPSDAAEIGLAEWVIRRAPRGLRTHAALAGAVVVVGCQLAVGDAGVTVHRACVVAVTVFSVSCSFCALSLRLRRSWSNTAAYSLLTSCCAVELALGHALSSTDDHDAAVPILLHPLLTIGVLSTAGMACVLSPLDAFDGVLVVGLLSVARYLVGTMRVEVPCSLRSLFIYGGGLAGVIGARCLETSLLQNTDRTSVTGTSSRSTVVGSPAGKTSDVKRRRASTSSNSYSSHAAARRISLPTLVHKSLVSNILTISCE